MMERRRQDIDYRPVVSNSTHIGVGLSIHTVWRLGINISSSTNYTKTSVHRRKGIKIDFSSNRQLYKYVIDIYYTMSDINFFPYHSLTTIYYESTFS